MTENNPQPSYQAPYAAPRRLVRSRDDRWLSGVCGGVAEYAGIDANLVRLVVVLGTIFGFGSLFTTAEGIEQLWDVSHQLINDPPRW